MKVIIFKIIKWKIMIINNRNNNIWINKWINDNDNKIKKENENIKEN